MGRVVRSGTINPSLSMAFSWAAAYRSKVDGSPCGDGYLVQETDTGIKLVVVDGAGSGARAAEARRSLPQEIGRDIVSFPHEAFRRRP